MTKKVRQWRGKARTTNSVIKSINKDTFASAICPTNVEEQKQKFLEFGKTPEFQHRGTEDELEEIFSKPRSEIRFDLLGEALHILKTVKDKYGDAENYYTEMYGERISKDEATDIIVDYLKENRLDGQMSIIWCSDLPCSGRMMWQGPHVKYRKPEARKYSMWIKDSKDNNFLRVHGIRCLADHEIGTHFFRSYNDGLQPWFADRTRFGVRGVSGLDHLRTEEGLAAINTILNAKVRYLWGPALLYYIACKATEMTFKQLFEHLTIYVQNPEWRWRHCVRVKRGLINPNDIGGYGKDQCYFEGAVEILRNVDDIDFRVLMSGKICYDEVPRVKKMARLDCIQMPAFMRNQEKYKKTLKQIAHMNGLHLDHAKYKAPLAYLTRLKRGRRVGVVGATQKVRKKGRRVSVSTSKGLGKGGEEGSFGSLGSEEEEESGEETRAEFLFQHFNVLNSEKSSTEDFFQKMKLTMEQNGVASEVNRDRFNYANYYKSLVDNFEKLKNENTKEAPVQKEGSIDVEVKSTTNSVETVELKDWQDDCVKTQYRCVSRASVQMVLNLPSKSLNSRSRHSSSDLTLLDHQNSFLQRPLTSFAPGRVTNRVGDRVERFESDQPHAAQVLSSDPLSVSLAQHKSPSTNMMISSTTTSQHCKGPSHDCSNHKNQNLFNPAPSVVSENHVKEGADGFIYPDNDILTDDMIKIKTGSQSNDLEPVSQGQCHIQTGASTQGKLLHRRVKSAANLLPKY